MTKASVWGSLSGAFVAVSWASDPAVPLRSEASVLFYVGEVSPKGRICQVALSKTAYQVKCFHW